MIDISQEEIIDVVEEQLCTEGGHTRNKGIKDWQMTKKQYNAGSILIGQEENFDRMLSGNIY